MQDPAVTVHLAVLDLSAPVAPGDLAWLDDEERARLAGFGSPTAARRFAASHAFLRRVLAARLGAAPSAVTYERSCEHCGHPGHGRPRLAGGPPGVEFSLSHSGRLAVVAVGPGPVGADVEDLARRPVAPGVVRRVTTRAERSRLPATGSPGRHRAVLELWTAKEAVAKALGLGVVLPFASFEVAPGQPVAADPAGGAPLAVTPVAVPGAVAPLALTPVAVPGAVASVAAPVGARVEVPTTQPVGEPAVER